MDHLQRAWYGKDISLALHSKSEQEYEDFFALIMQKTHSDNFTPIKAAGRDGDRKSDGYLIPEKRIYQVYAPSSGFKKSNLINKIEGDCSGAKKHWKDKMLAWTFVHNEFEGLPPYAIDVIEKLKKDNKALHISVLGPNELFDTAINIGIEKLIDVFGHVPTQKDMVDLTHEPIKTLLKAISRKQRSHTKLEPVSVDKLNFNSLSVDVASLLNAGRVKEKFVEDLISRWPDPEYGEDLATSFNDYYTNLKEAGQSPDEIFNKLQIFAGGVNQDAKTQVSSLAVLSYFFERCDIFDNPPKGWKK
ncbi:hypothetical protein PSH55_01835 [Pseudoalteromonas sp. Angola-31]|nr:hypothetical protein [Pseudoalteromonas sp. Angola-31]